MAQPRPRAGERPVTGETARAQSRGRWITSALFVILVAVTSVAVERGLTWRDAQAQQQEQLDAVEAAEAEGSASIQIDGFFVDYPVVEQARRTLDRIKRIRG